MKRKKKSRSTPRYSQALSILKEDESFVAVNKPPGLLSVPAEGSEMRSVLSILIRDMRKRTYVVHRIDRFTSGIVLFAKTPRDKEQIVKQFMAHTPRREYLAVVRGRIRENEGVLVHYLRRERMIQRLSSKEDRNATRAELSFVVERRLRGASLVRVSLVTGLQNQIRVQFAVIGHPIIGDRKYRREEEEEKKISRPALHAARLEFQHPRGGGAVVVECPPPKDFENLVRSLSEPRRSNRNPQ